jgi:hypothetical protein
MAEAKVKEFWGQTSALETNKTFASHNIEWAKYTAEEIEAVAAIAPDTQKEAWTTASTDIKTAAGAITKPSLAELEKARTNLKQNPFAANAIEEALALERKAQRKSMVEYLEGRLASLKTTAEPKEKQ